MTQVSPGMVSNSHSVKETSEPAEIVMTGSVQQQQEKKQPRRTHTHTHGKGGESTQKVDRRFPA